VSVAKLDTRPLSNCSWEGCLVARGGGVGERMLTLETSRPNERPAVADVEESKAPTVELRGRVVVGGTSRGKKSISGAGEMSIGSTEGLRRIDSKLSSNESRIGDEGAEVMDIVDANETSKSEERKSSASSRFEGVCNGELGWDLLQPKSDCEGEAVA
jgi:hypothetical protein